MSISVKSYLISDESSDTSEIRRFVLETTSGSSLFQKLQEQLQKLYSCTKAKELAIQWKDDEGDLITMSSDEELTAALASKRDDKGIFRIYVKYVSPKPTKTKRSTSSHTHNTESDSFSDELHPYVTCDGCDGRIHGFRYKCLDCPDFDLCHSCETKRLHPNHMMLRLPKPVNHANGGFPFMPWMFGRYGGRHHHGHHGFPGCHRKRFYQNENGAGHKSDGSGEASNEQTKFNYPFQFQQVLEKIWTALGGLPKDQNSTNNPQAASATGGQSSDANPQEFLQTIGETVAAMLDPLGINVEVDVDHNGVRHRCGETKNTAEASESQTESTVQDVPITVEKDNPVGENKSSDQQPTDEAKLPENIPASNSENSKLGNTSVAENENGDWMYISDKEHLQIPLVTSTSIPVSDSSAKPKAGPPITSVNDEINLLSTEVQQHPNPTIQSALNQMLTMGFTNEGGWLTQLLEVKNGNIDEVLEVLSPFGGKKN